MVEHGLVILGFLALIAGLWWLAPPIALIVGGLLLIGAGVKLTLTKAPARRRSHARSTARPTE